MMKQYIYFKNAYPDANGPEKYDFFENMVREAADRVEEPVFLTRMQENAEWNTAMCRNVSLYINLHCIVLTLSSLIPICPS